MNLKISVMKDACYSLDSLLYAVHIGVLVTFWNFKTVVIS